MTKMVAMPIYGKNPSKMFFRTGGPISTKLGMNNYLLKYHNVYINHDPVVTLTNFTTRSTYVAYAFEWGKLKMSFKGKTSQEMGSRSEY